MIALALIPLFSALNRAAGYNPIEDYQKARGLQTYEMAWAVAPDWMRAAKYATDKFACAGYAGLIVACWDCKMGIITALGFAIWRLFGWGAMFHAFNGRPYVGTGVLSKLVGKFLGDYPQTAAVVYGGLRGGLGIMPWACGIGYYSLPAGLALLAADLGMGAVYWFAGAHQRATGQDTGIKRSEWAFGALLGACMALAIWG